MVRASVICLSYAEAVTLGKSFELLIFIIISYGISVDFVE